MTDAEYVIAMGKYLPKGVDCVDSDGIFAVKYLPRGGYVPRDIWDLRFYDAVSGSMLILSSGEPLDESACYKLACRVARVVDLLRGVV